MHSPQFRALTRLRAALSLVAIQNVVRVTKLRKCGTATRDLAFLNRIVLAPRSMLKGRASREAKILVLRQQLLVLNRRSRKRVRLQNIDRLVLVLLYRIFPSVLSDAWVHSLPSHRIALPACSRQEANAVVEDFVRNQALAFGEHFRGAVEERRAPALSVPLG